ncbi:MAG: glycosyltransferase family 9 protein [candidate division Zixibacteria bacterium]|nr:glycosyltransferase family 9 protein [candidate division Zixibacteria bacterium]
MDELKPIEHKIKAMAFRIARPFLKRQQREFTPLDGNRLAKVLFLRPEKIGDMVISFPVFDGLRERYPRIKISILGSPRNEAIIRSDPRFDRIFMYKKRPLDIIREIRAMRRERFDCVVDMICDDSVTALFLSQLCAPGKPRIGVGKIKFREFYDFNYDHRMGDTGHIIENTLKLLEAFGIDSSKVSGYAPPYVDEQAKGRIDEYLGSVQNGSQPSRLIGYNLSAGSTTRLWAEEKSIELVKRLLGSDPAVKVILFTIPQERSRGERIASLFGDNLYQAPPAMSLLEASALIAKLDLFISPDTSLVHIARAYKVPVVGLYSRFMKNFLLWRPFGQEGGAVVSGNDDNIHDITVDQVFDAYQQLAAKRKMVPR